MPQANYPTIVQVAWRLVFLHREAFVPMSWSPRKEAKLDRRENMLSFSRSLKKHWLQRSRQQEYIRIVDFPFFLDLSQEGLCSPWLQRGIQPGYWERLCPLHFWTHQQFHRRRSQKAWRSVFLVNTIDSVHSYECCSQFLFYMLCIILSHILL